jgi:prophage antirepressor-like protein
MTDIIKKPETQLEPLEHLLFNNKPLRREWHDEQIYYSVVDAVAILTDSENPRRYWSDLKIKIVKDESGDQLYEKIVQLKLLAEDGRLRETDCTNREGLFRIIQSIPSKKAEPFKRWLAKVGRERLEEMADPELAINRARDYYQRHGRSQEWIQRRMMGQETRNKLTGYWKDHDIKEGKEYAILTDIIHKEWADLSVKEHKDLKGLASQNLRDHMTEAELILTALAELSTRQIAEAENATGMPENTKAAKKGGNIAKKARLELEEQTGQKVVSGMNHVAKRKIKDSE